MKFPVPLRGWARVIAKSAIMQFVLFLAIGLTRAFRLQVLNYLSVLALGMLAVWTGGKLLFGSWKTLSGGERELSRWVAVMRVGGAWLMLIGLLFIFATVRAIVLQLR